MFVISGALKNYEWGSAEGLRPWTQGSGPLAELWFGVHPSGPSPLVDSTDTLDHHVAPEQVPILVKLLSAAKPLSIQVHPNSELAQRGFHELNRMEAFTGAFADANEKVEMLYALENFEAFVGWRPAGETAAMLAALSATHELALTELPFAELTFSEMAHAASSLPNLGAVIASLPDAARAAGLSELDCSAYATVAREYPNDPGAILALYLRVVRLTPGESIFIPSGIPHSYIRGTGIEVMTSSDNVLRLGLTPKPVFIDLALQALDFTADLPEPSEAPFDISVFEAGASPIVADTGAYRVVLCLEGSASLSLLASEAHPVGQLAAHLEQGQAAVLLATEPDAQIVAIGSVAVVTAGRVQ